MFYSYKLVVLYFNIIRAFKRWIFYKWTTWLYLSLWSSILVCISYTLFWYSSAFSWHTFKRYIFKNNHYIEVWIPVQFLHISYSCTIEELSSSHFQYCSCSLQTKYNNIYNHHFNHCYPWKELCVKSVQKWKTITSFIDEVMDW